MLPEDNSYNWGAVLLRLLPWEQTQKKDLVMSVLKALAYNPPLAVQAPKWQPKVCVCVCGWKGGNLCTYVPAACCIAPT